MKKEMNLGTIETELMKRVNEELEVKLKEILQVFDVLNTATKADGEFLYVTEKHPYDLRMDDYSYGKTMPALHTSKECFREWLRGTLKSTYSQKLLEVKTKELIEKVKVLS